jgi:hypothetical protein
VSIPEALETKGTFVDKPTKVGGEGGYLFQQINPTSSDTDPMCLLPWGDHCIVSAYSAYDATGLSVASHFKMPVTLTESSIGTPIRLGTLNPGYYGGWMGVVPEEHRAAIGAPAVTGNGCKSIVSRTSAGPSLFGFNPDTMDPTVVPLLYYPYQTPCPIGPAENVCHTMQVYGVALVPGTRSVLFFGLIGKGPFCYGHADTLYPNVPCRPDPDVPGHNIAYDPTNSYQAGHSYPYELEVYAYNLDDLLQVKRGEIKPWEPKPYAVWPYLIGWNPNHSSQPFGFAYDPAKNRVYLSRQGMGGDPVVAVCDIKVAAKPEPEPEPPPVVRPDRITLVGRVEQSSLPGQVGVGDTMTVTISKPK